MNRSKILTYLTRALPIIVVVFLFSCRANREVTTRVLRGEIKYLSSDPLLGRLTGLPGDSLAALFIKNKLASYGLTPLAGDGFQRFKVPEKALVGKENVLSVNGTTYISEKDFMPMEFSSNSSLESEALFVGYGFNINADSLKWDDYKGIDPKGKWVIMLRADPEPDNTRSSFSQFSGDRDKALIAKDMGASGVLMVSGPSFDQKDAFESLNAIGFSVDIPVLRIKREVADVILAKSKKNIATLEKTLNEGRKPVSFSTKVKLMGKLKLSGSMQVQEMLQ